MLTELRTSCRGALALADAPAVELRELPPGTPSDVCVTARPWARPLRADALAAKIANELKAVEGIACLLYTSDAADE